MYFFVLTPVYCKLVELTNIEAENPNGRVKISSNHRDVQPLLDRPVYVSFNMSSSVTIRVNYSDRFKAVFDGYWSDIQRIRTSIGQAYRSVRGARESLVNRLNTLRALHS